MTTSTSASPRRRRRRHRHPVGAHAKPDGYTLMLGHTGTISINPSLYAQLGIDPRKDFAPIGLIASMPVALLAHPSFPARTVADVIARAKKDPGKLNVGTSAVGTGGYMCAELFKAEAGVDVAIIPYKGTAPVMNDLLGGHVPVAFGVLPPALGNLQAGQLRAIAVTSKKRFSLLPDVPTFDESGMPGLEAVLHYGLLAPAGTPPDIIEKPSVELRKLAGDPEVQKRIRSKAGTRSPPRLPNTRRTSTWRRTSGVAGARARADGRVSCRSQAIL